MRQANCVSSAERSAWSRGVIGGDLGTRPQQGRLIAFDEHQVRSTARDDGLRHAGLGEQGVEAECFTGHQHLLQEGIQPAELVGRIGDRDLAEHHPPALAAGAEQMRVHSTEPLGATQGLAIQSDAVQPASAARVPRGSNLLLPGAQAAFKSEHIDVAQHAVERRHTGR